MAETTNQNRRTFLKLGMQGLGISYVTGGFASASQSVEGIVADNLSTSPQTDELPTILYEADLFHPHGDPDDHFDLVTAYLLANQNNIHLQKILLDYPPAHREGDPGIIPVAQMNRLCGLNVPTSIGSQIAMKKRNDTLPDLGPSDYQSITAIIDALRQAQGKIKIACVGSSNDIVLAANREPDLFREKCDGVYLNAGSGKEEPGKLEYNTKLNPQAYAGMFDLPCPLYWFPCWDTIELRQTAEWGTFYWLPHEKALNGVGNRLMMFFEYMFKKSNDMKYIRFLEGKPDTTFWGEMYKQNRGMWSTASIFLMAQLTVTRHGDIVPLNDIAKEDELYRMEAIEANCADDGRVQWKLTEQPTNRYIFHILDIDAYPDAMARAINTLFLSLKD